MIGGILFTHGHIGQELLRTAETIIGGQDHIVALSNEGCSATLMKEALTEALERENFRDGVLIMVDLARGSCWVAAERIQQEGDNIGLISGVNLPMLLRFLYKRELLPLPELVENMCRGGIEGVEVAHARSDPST